MIIRTYSDQFAILVSTEWFSPILARVVPGIDLRQSRKIQLDMRAVVQEMMGGQSEYWGIEFSVDRVQKTHNEMIELFRDCSGGLSASFVRHLLSFGGDEFKEQEMYRRISAAFDKSAKLPNAIRGPSLGWREFMSLVSMRDDFLSGGIERLCLHSQDPWDKYTRELTPGLPSWLSDFFLVVVMNKAIAILMWGVVSDDVDLRRDLVDACQRLESSISLENDLRSAGFCK